MEALLETLFTDAQMETFKDIAIILLIAVVLSLLAIQLAKLVYEQYAKRRDARDPHLLQEAAEATTFTLMHRVMEIILLNVEEGCEEPLSARLAIYISIIKAGAKTAALCLKASHFALEDATVELLEELAIQLAKLSEVTESKEALVINRAIEKITARLDQYLTPFETTFAAENDEDGTKTVKK